ncbi:MAG: DUF445 family protein, partial [Caulobacteraceae bacterium]|nr:DUF445 family protein [Caulobacteraceae bacterium]
MRRTAGGLLAGMGGLYVGAHLFLPPDGPGGYVRAFAEAGLVGGLADWFAVTALFRRPLGLPIPHTGIIPRRHGDIAVAVGGFIREHFLNPELVEARVAGADLAEGLSRQLMAPGQIPTLARGLTALIPPLLETLEDREIAAFLRDRAEDRAGGGQ